MEMDEVVHAQSKLERLLDKLKTEPNFLLLELELPS